MYLTLKDIPGDVPDGTGTYTQYAKRYNETALAALNWVAAGAEDAGNGGYKWVFKNLVRKNARFTKGDTINMYHLEYGKGAPGIADAFLKAYLITGNEEYLKYVEGALKWIESNTRTEEFVFNGKKITTF